MKKYRCYRHIFYLINFIKSFNFYYKPVLQILSEKENQVDFIAEEGQTSGIIKATFYDGEATGTFVVKDGSVTCKLNPLSGYEFGEFRLYSSKDYHKFIFSFDCDWDTYSVTITLK